MAGSRTAGSITVHDVARAANVSASTVSRALAASALVAAPTRSRVIDAARRLRYSTHPAARRLITGRTYNIGLVVPDLENPYFPSVTKGVQARALREGYCVFIADADEDLRSETELTRRLSAQVDGLVLCSPRGSEADIGAVAETVATFLIHRRVRAVPCICMDDGDTVRQALEHLYALGHRRVAYAGGPAASWSDRQRRTGIRAVAPRLAGLDVLELGAFAPVFSGGRSAADLAIASGASPVLACNDLMALGILARLRTRRVHVPNDISVVGIDDVNVATLVSPALTTVPSPLRRVGEAAVNVLIGLIAPTTAAHPAEQLRTELMVRESTAVPAHSSYELHKQTTVR